MLLVVKGCFLLSRVEQHSAVVVADKIVRAEQECRNAAGELFDKLQHLLAAKHAARNAGFRPERELRLELLSDAVQLRETIEDFFVVLSAPEFPHLRHVWLNADD